jgi:hypothetical protein
MISRRYVIGASVAGVVAGSRGRQAYAALSTPMRTYIRMRGAAQDGGLALWWYTGNVWGKPPDDIARVLFKVEGLTFQRLTARADGGIDQRMTGRGWYADAATGEPLDRWTNPLTGETLEPPHIRSLTKQAISADGAMAAEDTSRLDVFKGVVGGLAVNGDTVWMTENFMAKSKPDAATGAVSTTSSLSTFTARAADIDAAAADFVPCYLNYQSLGSWPAWLRMGARPGTLSWQTYGRKVRGPEEGPEKLRAWIEARYPGFLAAPGI